MKAGKVRQLKMFEIIKRNPDKFYIGYKKTINPNLVGFLRVRFEAWWNYPLSKTC